MTTRTTQEEAARPALTSKSGAGRVERLFSWWTLATGLLVLAILALILITTTKQAWPAFQDMGLRFITSSIWDPNPASGNPVFGSLAFIYG
ncbi:MAG TPA: phosphate ABC transporter permease subunit PstC, partial [Actinomycetes bacterium]